jgi:hypothetical protein
MTWGTDPAGVLLRAGPEVVGLAAGEELLQEAKTTARTIAPRAPQIARTPPVKLKPS